MNGRNIRRSHGDREVRTAALAFALLIGFGSASFAGEPPEARKACISSVFKLCPLAALAGDHDSAKACLLKRLEKATPECQAAVRATLATENTPPSSD
jgi:hypothetical protein